MPRDLNRFLRWLMPVTCPICGCSGDDWLGVCPECFVHLENNRTACPKCATPPLNILCFGCQRDPPPFDRTLSPFLYQGSLRYLITRAKFRGDLSVCRQLGRLMAVKLSEHPLYRRPDVLLPVPLHPRRYASRGFNQALELAKEIARALSLPCDHLSATRVLNTEAQSSLSTLQQRRANVRGAFVIAPKLARLRRVAVVDDVMTTGSTLRAFCTELRRLEITEIDLWVCARSKIV